MSSYQGHRVYETCDVSRQIRGNRRFWQRSIQAALSKLFPRRVPLVNQMDRAECGAACLAMVLSYYGRKTSVAECRTACRVGRDGLTARTIARAAQNYGLRTRAYSIEPSDFRYVQLPAIVHWDFNHFVVVERWSPRQVIILDPAIGRRRLSAAEFHQSFTGIVLSFDPGAQFQPGSTTAQSPAWHYLQSLLRIPGTLTVIIQVLLVSLLLQLLGLALPVLTQIVVDHILPLQLTNMMAMLGLGMIVVVLSQMIMNYLRATLLIYLKARLDSRLMLGFFEHILSLPFHFFQKQTSGDLLTRLSSNTVIRSILSNHTLSVVLDGSFVLIYLVILLKREIALGSLALGIGIAQIALLLLTKTQIHDLNQRDLIAQAASQSYLVEALTGMATVKASGAEDRALDHWSNLFFKQVNVSLQRDHISAIVDTLLVTLRTFSPLFLLWFGALRVLDGTLSLGNMLGLNAIAITFLTPLSSLVSSGQQLQLASAHLERLTDILAAEPEQDIEAAQTAPRLKGQIELRQVHFRHDDNSPWVLRNISLDIQPGQKIAIVGRSGSGKSTLARLLLGLHTPTQGEILYEGISLQALNYQTLRRQFGVVLQEPFLFSGSIRQNIAFSNPDLPPKAIMKAAQLAAIHDEIARMPMAYETLLAEGGTGLSGGQRQRLAIARAVSNHPAILLLDEATSHLDTLTERSVDDHLNQLFCTRIVIAHRLSTIRNADVILVLDQGTIVEKGSHESLIAQDGYYSALVQGQLQSE